jgi:hypothetical protein
MSLFAAAPIRPRELDYEAVEARNRDTTHSHVRPIRPRELDYETVEARNRDTKHSHVRPREVDYEPEQPAKLFSSGARHGKDRKRVKKLHRNTRKGARVV